MRLTRDGVGVSTQPSEPEPAYSPVGGVDTLSARGEWIYTGKGIGGWERSGFIADSGGEEQMYSSISDIDW